VTSLHALRAGSLPPHRPVRGYLVALTAMLLDNTPSALTLLIGNVTVNTNGYRSIATTSWSRTEGTVTVITSAESVKGSSRNSHSNRSFQSVTRISLADLVD
jgi:hypothetical protein